MNYIIILIIIIIICVIKTVNTVRKEVIMVIKNTTTITKEDVKGVMYAVNCEDKRYRAKKLIFNGGGLIFGMVFVSCLMPELAYGTGSKIAIIISGLLCGILLVIGMYGMDINNFKKFNEHYSHLIGKACKYEIDSEEICIKDKESVLWADIIRWHEDVNNFYLFMDAENALIINKKGFTECNAKDMKDLITAIMYMRCETDDEE